MKQKYPISPFFWAYFAILLAFSGLILWFSKDAELVENLYAISIYPAIAKTLRMISRWVPFSLGDIFYLILIIIVLVSLIKFLYKLLNRTLEKATFFPWAMNLLKNLLLFYLVFMIFWGLNYSRKGIVNQLAIQKETHSIDSLKEFGFQLIDSMNSIRKEFGSDRLADRPLDSIYRDVRRAYGALSTKYEFLEYIDFSVKKSLYTPIADYVGFTGYYNPFSGEAQIRTDIPRIMVPFIVCHEIAHQIGYASEMEANFVGYLAAHKSTNPYLRYSLFLELFNYTQQEELRRVSLEKDFSSLENLMKENRLRMDTLVKQDRQAIRSFFNKRRNAISPLSNQLYDQYLKLNKQAKGLESYDQVVGWVMSYEKKNRP